MVRISVLSDALRLIDHRTSERKKSNTPQKEHKTNSSKSERAQHSFFKQKEFHQNPQIPASKWSKKFR